MRSEEFPGSHAVCLVDDDLECYMLSGRALISKFDEGHFVAPIGGAAY